MKRLLLISVLIIGIAPASNLTASTKKSQPYCLFPFKSAALNTLAWGSLGAICTTVAYRTMRDVYNKVPAKGHSRYLGDKILMSVCCWTFAVANALEVYKNYQ